MQTKIENYKNLGLAYARRLQDVRFAGQVLFVIIVLLISWSGIKAIQLNYGLQKQISVLKQQNNVQNLKNTNLKLQNDYYDTEQYLELAARQNFGLGKPGEQELLVPQSVALSYTVNLTPQKATAKTTVPQPGHLQAWANFFLHRPTPAN